MTDDAYSRAAAVLAEKYAARKPRPANVLDYAALPGAGMVDTLGSILSGLGATDTGAAISGGAYENIAPEASESLGGQVLSGIGSTIPFLVPGAGVVRGAEALGAGARLAGALGTATVGATGMAAEGGGAYQRAKAAGADDDQARTAAWLTAPAGLIEILPTARWAKTFGGILGRAEKAAAGSALGGIVKAAMVDGLEEAAQETTQTYWEDLIAREIHSPDDVASLLEAAKVAPSSFIVGALFGAVAKHYENRQAPQTAAATSPEIPEDSLKTGAAAGGVERESELQGAQTAAPDSAIEVPDADLAGARGRFLEARNRSFVDSKAVAGAQEELDDLPDEEGSQERRTALEARIRDIGPRGEPALYEAPEPIARRAAQVGAKAVMFDGGEGFGPRGYYDAPTKTIFVDANASPSEREHALTSHELVHFFADAHPDVYEAYRSAIDAVEPGWLERQSRDREKRMRATFSPDANGPLMSPGHASEEAVAESVEGLPSMSALVRSNRELAFKIASHSPGVMQKIGDALIDFANKVGLTERQSIGRTIRELEPMLTGHFEQRLGARRAAKLALKLAELEDGIRSERAVQPKASSGRLNLPVSEASEEHPTPEPATGEPSPGELTARRTARTGLEDIGLDLPDEGMKDLPVRVTPAPQETGEPEKAARAKASEERRTVRVRKVLGESVEAEIARREKRDMTERVVQTHKQAIRERALTDLYERNKASVRPQQEVEEMRRIANGEPLQGGNAAPDVSVGDVAMLPDSTVGDVIEVEDREGARRVTVKRDDGSTETVWSRQLVDVEKQDADAPYSRAEAKFALPGSKDPRKPLPRGTVEDVISRFGAKNEDQTARTSKGANTRAFQAGVRSARTEGLEPEKNAEANRKADRELREDKGLKERLLEKLYKRGEFEPWETVALSKLADRAAQTMFGRGTTDAIEEATRLRWVYEDLRRRQAQALQVIRDPVRAAGSGAEALSSVLSIATRKNREKLAKIMAKLDDVTLSNDARFALQMEVDALAKEEAKTTEKVLRRLRDAGLDPELVTLDYFRDPMAFSRAARIASTTKSGARDMFLEWRIASMLGKPTTQVANITGNTASLAYYQVVERLVESMVNVVSRNPDAASFSELGNYFRAWIPALSHAGQNMILAARTELPVFELQQAQKGVNIPGITTQIDALEAGQQAIPGVLGRILRAPSTTALLAMDEFFKTLAADTQAVALAHRAASKEGLKGERHAQRMDEILNDPSDPVHLSAWKTAKEVTFQDGDSPVLRGIMSARRALDDTFKFPIGSILLPFVRTPYRIFQKGLGIPFAPAVAAHHALTGKWKEQAGRRERDIAESVMGLGLSLGLLALITGSGDDDEDTPLVTGSRATDYGEALLQERTFPEQSFRVGGKWHSYGRVEPASVALTTVVDLAHEVRKHASEGKGAQTEAAIGRLASSIMAQASDKTWLRTLGDVMTLVNEPQSGGAARFARDTLVTPMIPNIIRGSARDTDPTMRANIVRPLDDQGVWERAARSIGYEALPISRRAPPIRYDLWGRDTLRNGRSYGERAISPIPENGVPDVSSLDIMLVRYNDRIARGDFPGEKPATPRPPSYDYVQDKERHYWSDEEYATLTREAGKLSAERLLKAGLDFENPTPQDIKKVSDAIARARKQVKEQILSERARR